MGLILHPPGPESPAPSRPTGTGGAEIFLPLERGPGVRSRASHIRPRTFSNYFASKEAAIVWPTTLRAARLADSLADRPQAEPLGDALVAAVAGLYGHSDTDGLPADWLGEFRVLVASEPALHGEYLKATAAAERALAASYG